MGRKKTELYPGGERGGGEKPFNDGRGLKRDKRGHQELNVSSDTVTSKEGGKGERRGLLN